MASHISCPSGQSTESRSQEDANVPNINGKVDCTEEVVDDTTGGHETGVHSATYHPSQRIPCRRVKPIPEFLSNGSAW